MSGNNQLPCEILADLDKSYAFQGRAWLLAGLTFEPRLTLAVHGGSSALLHFARKKVSR